MQEPTSLHGHAADNLRFIRDTMSRAGQFTAVPGWGGVVMGVTAIATAALAIVIAAVTMSRKARRLEMPLLAAPAKRFAFAYVPALAAGAVLTAVFLANGLTMRLPGCWLLLYGVAIATAGTLSVRAVQLMGVCFMALGAASFLAPAGFGDLFMAAGFGGLHVIFGVIIARNHGG